MDEKEINLKSKADCPFCGAQITFLTAIRAANPFSFKCTNCNLRLPEEANRITMPTWAVILLYCCLGAVFGHLKWHYGFAGLAFGALIFILWFAIELSSTLSTLDVFPSAQTNNQNKLIGIRGWLLFYCLLTMAILPAKSLHDLSKLLITLNKQPYITSEQIALITAVTVLWLFITIFGIFSGIKLIKHKESAVKTAKTFLVALLIVSIVISLSPLVFIPNIWASTLIKGNAIFYSQRLIFFLTWIIYFSKSRRVQATFPD